MVEKFDLFKRSNIKCYMVLKVKLIIFFWGRLGKVWEMRYLSLF